MDPKASIKLNSTEELIFSSLRDFLVRNELDSVWVVGGWVRDKLLGRTSQDIDLVFPESNLAILVQGISTIFKRGRLQGQNRGVTLSSSSSQVVRTEGATSWSLHQFTLQHNQAKYKLDLRAFIGESPESDCLTRDFSINAIYYRLSSGKIDDPCGGLADLLAPQPRIRCPIAPAETFAASPQRLVRLLRFSVGLNAGIDPSIRDFLAARKGLDGLAGELGDDQKQLLGRELRRIFELSNAAEHLRAARELGLHQLLSMGQTIDPNFEKLFGQGVDLLDSIEMILARGEFREFRQGFSISRESKTEETRIRLVAFAFPFARETPGFLGRLLNETLFSQSTKDIGADYVKAFEKFAALCETKDPSQPLPQDPEPFFSALLEKTLGLFSLNDFRFSIALAYFAYVIPQEAIVKFADYIANNLEQVYFEYRFRVLGIE